MIPLEEILSILPQAWAGQPFRHRGEVYEFPEVGVRPTPSAKVPILIGGGAEAAIRRAARLADGIFANVPKDQFLQQLAWIRDECHQIGRDPAELRVVHYSVMLPGASKEEAMERYTEHLWSMMWKYRDMEASASRALPPAEPPPFDDSKRDRLFGRATIAGTGDQIVEYLHGIREEAGVGVEFVARSFFHTLRNAEQRELMQQLAEEVSPHI